MRLNSTAPLSAFLSFSPGASSHALHLPLEPTHPRSTEIATTNAVHQPLEATEVGLHHLHTVDATARQRHLGVVPHHGATTHHLGDMEAEPTPGTEIGTETHTDRARTLDRGRRPIPQGQEVGRHQGGVVAEEGRLRRQEEDGRGGVRVIAAIRAIVIVVGVEVGENMEGDKVCALVLWELDQTRRLCTLGEV